MLEQETQIHPKVTPNLPIPSVPHQSLRVGSPSGRKPPRSLRIGTQRHPDTAQCSEHPQEAPTSPKHPPASQKPQGPARSVAPSGTPSTPFAPRASPGPSPAPAAPQQGSPVLMDAAGSRLQDPPARAWHGGRGQPWHRHPWGVVDHPPPAPPAGRGREGARKGGCGFESPRGKDVTPRVGPPRAGGCGQPPGRVAGGGLHPKEGPPALVGAPGSAPPAAPRSCCASGLASPRKQK